MTLCRSWRDLCLRYLPAAALLCLGACATHPPTEAPTETAQQVPAPEPKAVPGSHAAPAMAAQVATRSAPVALSAPTAPSPPQAEPGPAVKGIDPLNPAGTLDLTNPAVHTDLWERVRKGYRIPDLQGELVRKWEQFYAAKPDYMARMTERGGRYLFHIIEEIERRGMPADLALLPFIESAFNPQAMSVARASGMWQFIPSTGKDFALRQNVFRDDRRDVLASTRAALDYLQKLHGMFGDWQLALAAYNWGQGNVLKGIERARKAGLEPTYENLRMPDETRNYVPKLQAIKNIVLQPQAFGLALPRLENHPYFVSVPIDRDIDVALAARLSGLGQDEFQALNPQMNKPVILASGTPQVLLPYDNAEAFARNLPAHKGPLATWTAWVAPKTLGVAEAAKQVGMSEAQLREVNRIPPRMLVKAGSTLLVPRSAKRDADVSPQVADHATLALAPMAKPLRKVSIRAGAKGDSVAAVAKRYRVSAAQVAQWNGVPASATFRPGQAVVVMLPGTAAKPASTRVAAKARRTVKLAAARRSAG